MEKVLRWEGAKAGTWVWYRSVSLTRGPGDCCRGPGGCGFLTRAWLLLLLLLVTAVVIT